MRVKWVPIVLLFCVSLFAADSPFSGTWKLNPQKGHVTPPVPKSSIAHVENDGDSFKLNQETVDDKDAASTIKFDAKIDGKDYPITGDPTFDSVSIKRVDDHKIKLTGKKDGKVVGKETVTVSKDGQTTTVDFVGTIDGKEIKDVGVYDKQ